MNALLHSFVKEAGVGARSAIDIRGRECVHIVKSISLLNNRCAPDGFLLLASVIRCCHSVLAPLCSGSGSGRSQAACEPPKIFVLIDEDEDTIDRYAGTCYQVWLEKSDFCVTSRAVQSDGTYDPTHTQAAGQIFV
jgi:hypothetical protein